MILKVVTVQRIIKALLVAGVVSCLLYVALIDFSLRPNAGLPIHIAAGVFDPLQPLPPNHHRMQVVQPFEVIPEKYNEAVVKTRMINEKIKRLTGMVIGHQETIPVSNRTFTGVNYNVNIFYYCPVEWWTSQTSVPGNRSDESLNAVFYPEMGIYNCTTETIETHFGQINKTGIGVVLYSWTMDHKAAPPEIMENIFNKAKKFGLKISFVLEHFQDRTVQQIRDQIEFIIDNYSHQESFNRVYDKERRRHFPVFYIKDTYQAVEIDEAQWRELLSNKQSNSIRKTKYDAIVLNHIVTKDTLASSKRSQFDGFFTYSASNGETYASTWKNWIHISHFADQYKMLFIPTIGPGYVEKIWKGHRDQKQKHHSIRHRGNGNYYGVGWRTAIQLENDPFVSISSFNNWAEGTQIEPAVQRWSFRDYSNKDGNYSSTKYLDLTRYWIGEFTDRKNNGEEKQHFCHALRNDTGDDNNKSTGSRHTIVKGLKQRHRM